MRSGGPPLDGLDVMALRRRVLVTGLLSFALFLTVAYTLTALDVDDAWLLAGIALIYLLVTRPMLAPVREAMRLRRRLAYQSFLDSRPDLPEDIP